MVKMNKMQAYTFVCADCGDAFRIIEESPRLAARAALMARWRLDETGTIWRCPDCGIKEPWDVP